jgi:hypothetical protein
MADGATLGNPEPVDRAVVSSLLDGSFVTTESHGNREPSFQVWIEAPDSIALAYGEKLLFQQCSQRVEFGWTPPDGWGARTVFEAFTSHIQHQFDDLSELLYLRRSYLLQLTCYPFGLSEDEVTDTAVDYAVTPVTTVISDGTSTTGWTPHAPGTATSTVTSSGGSLVVTNWSSSGAVASGYLNATFQFEAVRALSPVVDFTATQYVTADVSVPNANPEFAATVDGIALTQVAATLLSSTGGVYIYRVTWRSRDTSASTLALSAIGTVTVPAWSSYTTPTFVIDNVQRSNQVPVGGNSSRRQLLRSVNVTGSARTTGSASIQHPTAGLGDLTFYTSRELNNGYSPDLSRWLDLTTGASNVAAAGNVSGRSFDSVGGSPIAFNVPATSLPAGPHLLTFRGSTVAAQTITWTASTVVGGVAVNTQTGTANSPGGGTNSRINLGVVTLPTVDIADGSAAVVRIALQSPAAITVDEAWSYYLGDDAALTQVTCGTGTPALGSVHNRVFLNAPSLLNGGRPQLLVGTAADGSDAYHPGYPAIVSWGSHSFAPPMMTMFVVTSGAVDAQVTLRHRPAWFTHAGQ